MLHYICGDHSFPDINDFNLTKVSLPRLHNPLISSWYARAAGTNMNGIAVATFVPSEIGNAAKKLAPVAP